MILSLAYVHQIDLLFSSLSATTAFLLSRPISKFWLTLKVILKRVLTLQWPNGLHVNQMLLRVTFSGVL